MWNNLEINKSPTPTVIQVKAIIKYMEDDITETYNFTNLMNIKRLEPNKISLTLNNGHSGTNYDILFNDENEIISFETKSRWMS